MLGGERDQAFRIGTTETQVCREQGKPSRALLEQGI